MASKSCTKINADDYEEEEVLIYAEFDNVLDDELFDSNSTVKIIGLDSNEPFIQVGNQMYCGKWKDIVGTALFFEEVEPPAVSDPVFSENPAKCLKYQFQTRKGLELSRVFINKKNKATDANKDKAEDHDGVKQKEAEKEIQDELLLKESTDEDKVYFHENIDSDELCTS